MKENGAVLGFLELVRLCGELQVIDPFHEGRVTVVRSNPEDPNQLQIFAPDAEGVWKWYHIEPGDALANREKLELGSAEIPYIQG